MATRLRTKVGEVIKNYLESLLSIFFQIFFSEIEFLKKLIFGKFKINLHIFYGFLGSPKSGMTKSAEAKRVLPRRQSRGSAVKKPAYSEDESD